MTGVKHVTIKTMSQYIQATDEIELKHGGCLEVDSIK